MGGRSKIVFEDGCFVMCGGLSGSEMGVRLKKPVILSADSVGGLDQWFAKEHFGEDISKMPATRSVAVS